VGVDQESLWVAQARQGNQDAFARLVEAYQVPVYNLAYRMLGSAAEAEDATQETFVRVYTRFDTYDPTRKFSSWILSIASHHCVDRLRRRRDATVSMEEIMAWRWVPDERPRPEERVVTRERSDEMRRLLDALPPQYRLVIVLRYWYDMSYDEIAEVTASTISAVKSRLHRARQVMGAMLADQDGADSEGDAADEPAERRLSPSAVSHSF
jgi:RNA polymerase sigma-70 factor (ECF subfamily)